LCFFFPAGIAGLMLQCWLTPLSHFINPSQSKQMAAIIKTGSFKMFYPVKRTFSSPLLQAQGAGLSQRKVTMHSISLASELFCFQKLVLHEFD